MAAFRVYNADYEGDFADLAAAYDYAARYCAAHANVSTTFVSWKTPDMGFDAFSDMCVNGHVEYRVNVVFDTPVPLSDPACVRPLTGTLPAEAWVVGLCNNDAAGATWKSKAVVIAREAPGTGFQSALARLRGAEDKAVQALHASIKGEFAKFAILSPAVDAKLLETLQGLAPLARARLGDTLLTDATAACVAWQDYDLELRDFCGAHGKTAIEFRTHVENDCMGKITVRDDFSVAPPPSVDTLPGLFAAWQAEQAAKQQAKRAELDAVARAMAAPPAKRLRSSVAAK